MLHSLATSFLWVTLGLTVLAPRLVLAQVNAGASVSVDPVAALVAVEVVVVRDGDVPGGSGIDDALARSLREVGGFTNVTFAPVPLAELRLALGCADDNAPCVQALASALDATAIVVRRVRTTTSGTTLTLVYRDGASTDAPLVASRTGTSARLVDTMSSLVGVLFGAAAPLAPSAPHARLWTWLTLGTGAAVLVGGAVVGASASWGDYTTLEANTSADLARIEDSYAAARSRAVAGNVLLGVGALVLGVGGALLVVDLLHNDVAPGADRLDLALSPSMHGAMLTLRRASMDFL